MCEADKSNEWDSIYEKCSHEGKLLIEHINEVKNILRNFLKFYGNFSELYFNVAEYLSEFHDYGKLHKSWKLGKKGSKPHSPLSVRWLMANRKIFETRKELTYILWYFILKHHSKLTNRFPVSEYNFILEFTKAVFEKLNFEEKVNLVDVFGLFKITDVISASNKSYCPKEPLVSEELVRNIIGKRLDERWGQQLKLKELGNVGILRAYTGWGKTTASLLFFVNKPVKKIFYLLPTITAINKFYKRLAANLSDDVSRYFYLYDAELSEELDKLSELFFVRNFLSPYVITTVDQFLLSFMQYGKYHTKRVMFRGAGLIFDEVHLLNPVMLHLLTYFLKKFNRLYRFKTLFMSATLPDALHRYIASKLSLPSKSILDYSNEYYKRRRVMIFYSPNSMEKDVDLIVKYVEKGRKILVILNTVKEAIKLAGIIREYLSPEKVILLHSRFMYRDRRKKEEEIEKKASIPHVLVSTQVSEVSLDISYDILFTETSPLSSMIQRFGRVNRYGTWVNKINTYVYNPKIENDFYYPYETSEIEVTEKILMEVEGDKLKSEGQLLDLFNEEYSWDNFVKTMKEAERKVDLEAFEEELNFLYSLDVDQERLARVLSYRDSFTTLIVPDPECVRNRQLKEYVENLISHPIGNLSYEEKIRIIAKIKSISVPVPIWWKGENIRGAPYPVIYFEDKIYDEEYGLAEKGVYHEFEL